MKKTKRENNNRSTGFIGKIIDSLRRLLNIGTHKPKEYRPYLGPQSVKEDPEEQRLREKNRKKNNKRKPDAKKPGILKTLSRDLEIKRELKRARKQKKRKVKKRNKDLKKEKRIEFIRKYYPQYKRTAEDWFELSWEDNAEEIEKFRHRNYFTYTVNSIASFLLAYLFVYIFYQFAVLIVAANYKLDSILFYYDLVFNDFSPLWNRKNIILVTFAGPFLSLIFGFLFLRYLAIRPKISKQLKLLTLWIGLHGFNFFLGAFASGVSFDEGFGYVPAWLFLNIFWKILLSMLFLFLLGVTGYYAAPKFLDTSYSLSRVRPEVKIKFLIAQVVLPWIIGSLIIFLVKIPSNMPYDAGILITMLFAVIPMIFNNRARPTRDFKVEKVPNKFNYRILFLTLVLILLYRLGLNNGLHIELFYDFIFSLDIKPL